MRRWMRLSVSLLCYIVIRAAGAQAGDRGQLALRLALRGAGVERRRVSSMASTSLSTAR